VNRIIALMLVAALALPARAADRERIAALNVAGTTLFTWLGCVVRAKLTRTPAHHGRCLAAGAIGGAGFYEAKRLMGEGHVTTGWLVANAAASVVENTTAGEHPLSRIGYTFGPLRLRVVTPFDRARESIVDVDISAAETGYLARAIHDADDVDIRDGMIWSETRRPSVDDQGRVTHGYTWGIYPSVWSSAARDVWHHEAVHSVQSMQLDSVEPPALTLDRERRMVRVRFLRAGALNVADNISAQAVPYEDRWVEIEAYRLAEDANPPR
jgi:hypothetical protein